MGISPLGLRLFAQVVRRFFDSLKNRLGFSRRPTGTVACTSKERKRKSSGTKTAWVFSYEPVGNEPLQVRLAGASVMNDDVLLSRTAHLPDMGFVRSPGHGCTISQPRFDHVAQRQDALTAGCDSHVLSIV